MITWKRIITAFALVQKEAYLNSQHAWNDNILNVWGNIIKNKNKMIYQIYLHIHLYVVNFSRERKYFCRLQIFIELLQFWSPFVVNSSDIINMLNKIKFRLAEVSLSKVI